MFDEFPAGSLVLFDWRTADALANATVRAMRDGSLKRVGVLLMLDGDVLASRKTLLKISLTLRTLGMHHRTGEALDQQGQDRAAQ